MKALFILVFILSVAFTGLSQTRVTEELSLDGGATRHAGIDDVYRKFSKAYRELDHKVFAELYSDSAAYLVPGDEIMLGGQGIVKSFESFFTGVRARNEQITISFQILQRKVSGTMGYDVGIYTLSTFKNGVKLGSGRGKFIVVAVREGDRWRFEVDAYNDLPKKPAQ